MIHSVNKLCNAVNISANSIPLCTKDCFEMDGLRIASESTLAFKAWKAYGIRIADISMDWNVEWTLNKRKHWRGGGLKYLATAAK